MVFSSSPLRLGISFGFLACLAVAPCAGGVVSHSVAYHSAGERAVIGYMAEPSELGVYPAVVMTHDWWGANLPMKQRADQLAERGFVALLVDLFEGETTREEETARELGRKTQENSGTAFANLEAAVRFLKGRRQVESSRVAFVGWVYGERWTYRVARNELGLAVSVIFHGRFNSDTDLQVMKGSVMGGFAPENQTLLHESPEKFMIEVATSMGAHRLLILPNGGRVLRMTNDLEDAIDEQASEATWARVIRFLEENL